MRRLFLILLIFTLVGCAPSQNVIQTAIAKTETARPTATYTPVPPTATLTSSPLPPTATSAPKTALHKLLVTINDFATLSEYYKPNPLINDKVVAPIGTTLDSCDEFFGGNENFVGSVTIGLYRYADELKAQDANRWLKNNAGNTELTFTSSGQIKVPDDFWMKVDPFDNSSAGATYKDVLIFVKNEKTTGIAPEKMGILSVIIIQSQITRLEDGGY